MSVEVRIPPQRDQDGYIDPLYELEDASSSSTGSYGSSEDDRLAQQEWEESLRQLQLIFTVALVPYVGKYFGRKWSYWAYQRWLRTGFSWAFWSWNG